MEEMTAYLASEGYVDELVAELGGAGSGITVRGRLALAPGPPRPAAWAANVWLDPCWIPIDSIGHGAARLRDIQRNWALYSCGSHRRAALIQAKLPHVSAKPHIFGDPAPAAPLGSWTLWEENLILASPACTSPFPHGELCFVENKTGPPNRAYLKLWELFTLLGTRPKPRELCLDLGSSPGGWTWVLHQLGASVFSVDKADLAPSVSRAAPGGPLPRQRLRPGPAHGWRDRLAFQRYGLLPGEVVYAHPALARTGAVQAVRVHPQVPGGHGPRHGPTLRGHTGLPPLAPVPTTSTS